MRIDEEDWAPLEAERHPYGIVARRLFPRSGHDIFLAVQQPSGRRALIFRVPATAAEAVEERHPSLASTRGLALQFAAAPDGNAELRVVLTADDRREVFNPLIVDVALAAQATEGPGQALTAAIERFEHWRRLLQSLRDTGLGMDARRGLFGELVVLRDHLLPALSPAEAISAWRGPTGANQDFQLPGSAIEVKTGAGRNPGSIVIASERQLDETGTDHLILAHLSVDERRGGSGESLNEVVGSLKDVMPKGQAQADFGDLLVRVGYLSEHRHMYEDVRYTVRRTDFWQVTGDFPRIVEVDLRPGVGDCRYRISTAGLDQYGVSAEWVANIVKGKA
ncbi:Putative PD-(D/E)XK family member [Micromonospora citrea]|uniref:Putative PD-(D/E)XK family member n=1 Tax=Micromonospora citrea TaxID=47855 RepID=A0A1C6UI17_9ACTN|nr:PD-(D/E)XK motif protein [Micromonospora citrea]SCL53604.1 Putative PD-(D/E)XK family member [Micromonospora citrea]